MTIPLYTNKRWHRCTNCGMERPVTHLLAEPVAEAPATEEKKPDGLFTKLRRLVGAGS